MCRVNVRVGLQQKGEGEERKASRVEGEEKKLLTHTHKKKVGAGGGGCWREGGDLWGTFITTQRCPRGGQGRGVERRRQNIPFPLPLLLPIQKPHRGWRALSPDEWGGMEGGRGVFAQKGCMELRWNKHCARTGPGFKGSARRNVNRSGCRRDSRPGGWRGRAWPSTFKGF